MSDPVLGAQGPRVVPGKCSRCGKKAGNFWNFMLWPCCGRDCREKLKELYRQAVLDRRELRNDKD